MLILRIGLGSKIGFVLELGPDSTKVPIKLGLTVRPGLKLSAKQGSGSS